ncbi:WD repeat and HMG-box DNA binding-domain containing protein 1 [Phytophthora pseudosyringae]|uniref:WD repeat and HMG-box DNA binding-domain containing protein 1 n=1 Tax=Phytophthora pseudosyringae TaxID=221518 RepID=A0A8T1WK11_9STRA|nr:WD repeat and HMG-box DNA binding-domain containing protein 1 [Phytophthora pseudosyringae]
METMKEIAVNVNGKGAMQLVTTLRPMKDGQVPAGRDVVFTSGEDGVLYVTDLATESSVYQAEVCEGFVPSFAVTPEQSHVLLVSDDDSNVASYSLPPDCQLDQLLRRSTVAIREVACSPKFIAIADEEPVVRVLLRSDTEQVILAEGATGAIKSVVLDPQEKYICASSEDATVRVFALDAEGQRATEAKRFQIKHGDIRNDDVLLRCAWQPSDAGKLLAVPMDKGIIELFERDLWASKGRLMLPIGRSTAADVDILAFSPNGRYLAAVTCAKEVFVWELETQTVLRSFRIDYPALGVQFANKSNAMVLYHTGGKLAFVKDVIPAGHTPPQHMLGQPVAASTSVKPSQSSKKHLKASSFVDDEAEVDGKHDGEEEEEVSFEDDNEARVEAIKASFGFGAAANAASDDRIEDEEVSLSAQATTKTSRQEVSPLRTITEPFQPGSIVDPTGRSSSGASLLAWTPEGEIEVIRGASMGENLVKVEFTDKSRRAFKFNDNYMFSMAFLDDYGAAFAVPRRAREDWEDLETGSSESDIISSFVFYRPFESWASNSSWHKTLPEGEDAECVAAGREFCAVATSLQTLRIYTTSGFDYALLRLPGRVVTMTAKESLLAVVYQGLHGQMLYQLLHIQVDSSRERVVLVSKGDLPMTPPPRDVFASHKENEMMREDVSNWSKLTWLGFDDRQILYAVDSFSCIQALSLSTGWNWFPIGCVGNTLQKKPEDRHGVFTLGVVNDSLLYFPLEKGARAPKLRGNHRPVPGTFPLRTASFPKTSKKNEDASNGHMWQNVRLCGLEAIANEGNADNVADQIVHEQAEMDKALILMMKTACTNDEPARVLDLAKCLHLEKSHQIAQKLAIHFSLRQLQSQLYQLYRVKFEAPQRLEQDAYSSQPRRQPRSYSQEEDVPDQREVEPLRRARSILSRPPSTPPRQEQHDEDTASVDETHEDKAPGSPKAAAGSKGSAARAERSVAPANPFLKKPGGSAASPSGSKGGKKSGLQRLAKFASPPPAKKQRRSTWKK